VSKPSDIVTFLKTKLSVPTSRYPANPDIDTTYRGANKNARHRETFSLGADIQIQIVGIQDDKIGEIDKEMYNCTATVNIDLHTQILENKGSEDTNDSQTIAWDNSKEAVTNIMSQVDFSELKDADLNSYINNVELIGRNILDGSFGLDDNLVPIRHTYIIEFETLEEF